MPSDKTWVEELLEIANREYYERCLQQSQRPAKAVLVPDLKDNEFWDNGESTS